MRLRNAPHCLRGVVLKISHLRIVAFLVASLPSTTVAADISDKLQPYIGCINRLSERAYQSQSRYVEWAGTAATLNTKARNILGLYEIYDPADCAKGVVAGNGAEPRHAALEAAGTSYVTSVIALQSILKTANDYYDQGDYKDDKMAKGRELHPKLLAAFKAFDTADTILRGVVETLNDEKQTAQLAAIEAREGRGRRYLIESLMIKAKALVRAETKSEDKKVDVARIVAAVAAYEAALKDLEEYASKNPADKIGSMFLGNAKSYLISAKELMRRLRDKVPYNEGERMILNQPNAGWMVQGSQPRVMREYNQLIDTYNRNLNM
jgi:Protein of unknown function (DUF3829)